MPTSYPGSAQDLDATRGTAGDKLNNPDHITHHQTEDDTLEAVQTKLGTGASSQTPAASRFLVGTGAGTSDWSKVVPTGTVVGDTDTQTLTSKTLTTPTIGSFTNANHDHEDSSGGAILTGAALTSTDGLLRTTRYYTASDTWSKPLGLKFVIVEVQGGGGGGGGANSDNSIGAGGGGGGYSKEKIAAGSLAATETVTVGAAGAGGAPTGAGTGGTSSFGTTPFLSATGGAGGPVNGGVALGGSGSGGDLNMDGGRGGLGGSNATSAYGGGGTTIFGGNGINGTPGSQGSAGVGYGAGGGGGHRSTTTSRNGADGKVGIVIVYEYF